MLIHMRLFIEAKVKRESSLGMSRQRRMSFHLSKYTSSICGRDARSHVQRRISITLRVGVLCPTSEFPLLGRSMIADVLHKRK